MNTQTPSGWTTSREYFKLSDEDSQDDSDSESESESDTDRESSESEYEGGNPKMLKGYLKNTKKYKKILFEDDLFPE
jgi:hypothetical protein